RTFTGSVWTAGHFTAVGNGCNGQCPIEQTGYLSMPLPVAGGARIDWDSHAPQHLAGVDFIVDSEPLFIDSFIEGIRQPRMVYFPSADTSLTANPDSIPFGLISQ